MAFRSSKSSDKDKKAPKPLETIIIEPTKKHSASVIFLHGLGNNADNQQKELKPVAEKHPHIKFIIPQAPTIPVSMNRGSLMPAWYDIKGNPRNIMSLKEDRGGVLYSVM